MYCLICFLQIFSGVAIVYGVGQDYDPKYAGHGTVILDVGSDLTIHVSETVSIPRWVKDISGWQAHSAADNVTFIQDTRCLIQNDTIKVPKTGVGSTAKSPDQIQIRFQYGLRPVPDGGQTVQSTMCHL